MSNEMPDEIVAGEGRVDKLRRPECFDFGMEFMGSPESVEITAYIEKLESVVARDLERRRALADEMPQVEGIQRYSNGPIEWIGFTTSDWMAWGVKVSAYLRGDQGDEK
jgi:hypothetical protein